jgi:ferredoxin
MPREHTVTLLFPDDSERVFRVSEDEPVLIAALADGIDLPFMCLQGWCLTCAGRVCNKTGEWDQSESRRYYDEDRKAGFILLCTAHARSDLIVQTHQRVAMRDHRRKLDLPAPESGID